MRVWVVVVVAALAVGCNRKGFDPPLGNDQPGTDEDPVTDTDEPPPNPDFDLVFVQQPGDTAAGEAFSTAPILEIRRKDNGAIVSATDALATASVRLSIADGNGLLRGTTTMSAIAGRINFSAANLSPELGGTMTLRATADPGLSAISRSITVTLPVFTMVQRMAGPEHSRGHRDGAVVSDNIASVARMNAPSFAAADATGLYITDIEDNTIRKYTVTSGVLSTVAGVPYEGGNDDAGAGHFAGPSGIAVNGDTLYVAELYNNDIRKITRSSGAVSTWVNTSHNPGLANGAPATSRLSAPYGLTLSGTSLFVADCGTGTIRFIDTGTGTVQQRAGNGDNTGDANGNGTAARMGCVTDVAYSSSDLFVVDGSAIRTVSNTSPYAVTRKIAGFGSSGIGYVGSGNTMYVSYYDAIDLYTNSTSTRERYSGDDEGHVNGARLDARFSHPTGMVIAFDRIFVMDTGNSAVRVIDPSTNLVTTLVGVPESGRGFSDAVGDAARFWDIRGMASVGSTIYVADEVCVRAVSTVNGSVTTFAGACHQGGFADSIGTDARFGQLIGITTDGTTLFVTDSDAAKIRAIDIATRSVTTFAGNGSFSQVDGIGENAELAAVRSLTYAQGKLYVVDANTIRSVDTTTREVSTFAGVYQSQGCIDGDAAAARTDNPRSPVVYNGGLFFMEDYCDTLRRVDLKTREVTTVAGDGSVALGAGTDIDFPGDELTAMTTDGRYLYLSFYGEGMVRRIDPNDGYRMAYYLGEPTDPREQNGPFGDARVVDMRAALWRSDGLWVASSLNLRVIR